MGDRFRQPQGGGEVGFGLVNALPGGGGDGGDPLEKADVVVVAADDTGIEFLDEDGVVRRRPVALAQDDEAFDDGARERPRTRRGRRRPRGCCPRSGRRCVDEGPVDVEDDGWVHGASGTQPGPQPIMWPELRS